MPQHDVTVGPRHHPRHRQDPWIGRRLGVGADGQRASTAQLGQERTLGLDHPTHARTVDGSQCGHGGQVIGPTLDGQRALGHLGQHRRRLERLDGDAIGRLPLQPVHGGSGGHHCSHPVLAHGRQPGGQVPAQVGEGQIGSQVGQLHPAAGGPGGDGGPGGQVVEACAHQHVPGIAPLGEGGQHQAGHGQFAGGGQILGRVHSCVGIAADHRGLDLFDEHALAPELGQRDVGAAIALGVDHHQLGVETDSTE